ncbi:MAG: ABC transporter ATP-binding protein [Planctomycetaceae bacterium]
MAEFKKGQTTMLDPVIRTDKLSRYFGSKPIVRDLNLRVPPGQVTALLGLNGAGKTTTIRIVMGLLRPTRGCCEVLQHDSSRLSVDVRMKIGYMVEGHYLYPNMRVRECAAFQRAGYSCWNEAQFDQIVDHFGIAQSDRIGHLSRGQRAGVSLALVLAPDPELLVLDDPALGLDPVSRRALNETLIEFAGDGQRTVLLSSHLLDDVERIADRVLLMIDGRLQVNTTLDDFRQRVTGYALGDVSIDPDRIAAVPGLIEARHLGNRLYLTVADSDEETAAAVERLNASSIEAMELPFTDQVLAWLSRRRGRHSFLGRAKTGETV